jgi:hypothetical protein
MQNHDIYTKERKQKIALYRNFGTHAHTLGVTKEQLIDCCSAVGIILVVLLWLAV